MRYSRFAACKEMGSLGSAVTTSLSDWQISHLGPRVPAIGTKTGEDERVVFGSMENPIGIESQPVATEGRDKDVPPGTAKVGHSKSCIPPGSRRLPAVRQVLWRRRRSGGENLEGTSFSRLLRPLLMSAIPSQLVCNKLPVPKIPSASLQPLNRKPTCVGFSL